MPDPTDVTEPLCGIGTPSAPCSRPARKIVVVHAWPDAFKTEGHAQPGVVFVCELHDPFRPAPSLSTHRAAPFSPSTYAGEQRT
jgi:hypothetical protein